MRAAAVLAVAATLLPAGRAAAPPAPEISADLYAVVIGWNGGNAALPPLRFADDDAVRLALFFKGLAHPGQNVAVTLLTETDERTSATLGRAGLAIRPDGPPTREAVRSALARIAGEIGRRPGRRPMLYVVYAGHGLAGRVLLKPTHAEEAALTGHELRSALAEVAAVDPAVRMFVFLDACRSESLFAERGPGAGGDFGAAIADLEQRATAVSIGVLTAARSGRPAGEVRRLESGYFSHVLASGLAGGADADGDDVVSFGELAAFVAFHTQKLTGQMPWFDPPNGDLQARTLDHRGQRGRLLFTPEAAGRFMVGAAGDGLPIFAEAYKDAGRALKLTLPPGRYLVRREARAGAGAGAAQAAVDLGGDRPVDLASASWQETGGARGPEHDEAPSFSSAFSPDVVATLAAGYHAGRAPTASPDVGFVRLELGAAQAPLSLGGAEGRLGLRAGRRLGPISLAAAGWLARSSHQPAGPGGRYALYRLGVGAELGVPLPLLSNRSGAAALLLEPFLGAGWAGVLRRGDGATAGDLRGLWAAPGLRLSSPVAPPLLLSLALSFPGAVITVDGDRQLTGGPALDLGVEVSF